ncbi:lysophospholipid acyltransferase family protein [Usitatibacter palustris]|uniref:Phospholipid/glycerol acyltransferase domain-containing protein n=1 Tax=Usitatibacter palustris TaxID=2732487 RepID=A0A6M4H4H3_9PROT|nr:lysophospholipid acyltransferase family protein [Usitatibacter palustris]QJR14521.1 hypothetical protein DSM104440_01322 [Usitatibacter palustris]
MHIIDVAPRVPRRGSAATRFLGRTLLRAYGWNTAGEFPNVPKYVIAVAPHTSNWDFVMGMCVMFALDLKLSFLAKHTIFVWPFAPFLRWMGGIPVDRTSSHGVVGESIASFAQTESQVLVVAPEGTRSHVEHFKVGFLHIARGAGVPVVLAALDYDKKEIRFGPTIEPGEDVDADRTRIETYFAPIRGKNPRKGPSGGVIAG